MKPRTTHENYAVKVRERFGRMTPLRLGMVIGEEGDYLPSPYAPGSRGDTLYMEGLVFGRKQREKRLAAAGVAVVDPAQAVERISDAPLRDVWLPANDLQLWIVEYGAIDLPMGDPSRLTCFEVHESAESAQAAIDAMDFTARMFPVPVPPHGVKVDRPLGCALAMRVMQSDLYKQLDYAERADCDELVRQNLEWFKRDSAPGVPVCPECGPVTKCHGTSEAKPCPVGELDALSREVDAMPGAIRPPEPWPRTSGVAPSDGGQRDA